MFRQFVNSEGIGSVQPVVPHVAVEHPDRVRLGGGGGLGPVDCKGH